MKNHNQYNGGIADVWYSGPKGDLWVEYKFNVLPKREDTLVVPSLSELQREWLSSRHHEGRRVGVIIGSKEGGVWLSGLTWSKTLTAKEFRERLHRRPELAEVIMRLTL